MKKTVLISATLLGLFPSALFAQCCNVYASNNTAITTGNGACVTLTSTITDCYSATVATAADTDGDGVLDGNDSCPTVKGLPENKGCPAVTVEMWTLMYGQLRDVRFATDSDSLTSSSFVKLDNVAELMKENSQYTLKVSGYADSDGTDAHNKALSEKRAKAVKSYLEAKGVPSNKVKLAAYGEKFPKAPNETESGKTLNRRVEFDVFQQ